MILSLEVPDAIARQLHLDGPQGSRSALEMLALAGYWDGDLSRGQVSELLGLSFWETGALLNEHDCGKGLTFEEFQQDAANARRFLAR